MCYNGPMKKVAPIVIANWKANPDSLKMAKANFIAIKKIASQNKKVNVIVCPPVLFLESLKNNLKPISLGAQDFFPEPQGAFTGSIGYEALLETKIKYVIIGHSERRAAGETNALINKKLKTALSVGLTPILCIGEVKRDANLEYLAFLKQELSEAFKDIPKSHVAKVVVAYEPLWAIGATAKRNAKPSEIEEIVIFIKRVIGDLYQTKSVPPIQIVYGGSVTQNDVSDIMSESGVDGVLVGHASLNPAIFSQIVHAVSQTII